MRRVLLMVLCIGWAAHAHAADQLYRCARDFERVLGRGLANSGGYWTNYGPEWGPQDWHYADSTEVLSNYDDAQYVRTWWDGPCYARFADVEAANYRVWVWARDDAERDMAICVYTTLDTTRRPAAHEGREGWYDCGVVAMEPGALWHRDRIYIAKATTDHPTAWALVKAVYLTKDLSPTPPSFTADGQKVPAELSYTYKPTIPVDHDWVLRWSRGDQAYPRLVVSASEIERVRANLARPELQGVTQTILNAAKSYTWDPAQALWLVGNWSHYPHAVNAALAYLITGDTSYAVTAKKAMIAHMRQHALAFHRRPPSGENWDRGNNTLAKFFRQCLLVYDLIQPSGVLSEIEDREVRALFASLAYYMERHPDGKWEGYTENGDGYWWWNGNTDRYTAVGLCGLLFPDHPKSADWVANAKQGFEVQRDFNIRPDGTWPESSNYAFVTTAALNTFFRAYENVIGDSFLDDAKVRKFYDWHVETMSTRIPTWWKDLLSPALPGGEFSQEMRENWTRLEPTVRISQGTGESAWNNAYGSVLATGAALWAKRDPALAGRLKWAWQEWGGQLVTEAELIAHLIGAADAADIPATPQTLESARVDGYAVCRDRFGDPEHELELFVDAQFKRSHGYPDLGQYHLYAYGVPITKDWDLNGESDYYKTEYWNVPWDRHVARYPWNYATDDVCSRLTPVLGDGDVFFTVGGDAVHVSYEKARAHALHRNYLLVKYGPEGRGGAPYVVVFDDAGPSDELYQTCYAVATGLTREGTTLRFDGFWGVDYEVHYLVPELSEGEPWLEQWFATRNRPPFQRRPDIPMVGRSRLEKNPRGGDWVWIGYPRKEGMGDLAAAATQIGDGCQRVDVAVEGTHDVALLATSRTQYAAELDFDGRYGLSRRRDGSAWVSLTCLGGGHLADDTYYVGYEGGNVSLVFDDTLAVGDVSGPGGKVRVLRPGQAAHPCGVQIDSVSVPYGFSGDTVNVIVPAGRHALVLGRGEPIIVSVARERPRRFDLCQNTPNPFNPTTTIRFSLPEAGAVRLVIYSTNGQVVRTLVDGRAAAGTHTVRWDGRDDAGQLAASGVYLYRLTGKGGSLVRRMVLVR